MTNRPEVSEYPAFYAGYVASVPGDDVVGVLQRLGEETAEALASIPEERGDYRYADGKWSVRV